MSEEAVQPQFALQRIYLKDASFEVPGAPRVFLQNWSPEVSIDLATSTAALDEGKHFEVTLALTVTARNEGQTAFLIEVKQAGIFQIEGVPETELGPLLGAYCPNLLFPYAREAVSDIVSKGSFPQLLLQPVNFDAVYAESLRQQQGEQEASA
ncbi:protein-export chaperone SecB [Amnimonas aquatica]|uniref:Protein-export protein SecB n=1 Tax=Amnimonas aquatica TaxID=2094561 RepID=A0A2P6AV27_9GAMM|nr:protein-export chaperone SecB [Amnimonas aquatica]PQA51813.1 protein-export chaperone SecB [Amnimonas aquatica]